MLVAPKSGSTANRDWLATRRICWFVPGEQAESEARLASRTSYNGACPRETERQRRLSDGKALCWFGPGEQAESKARLASRTSYNGACSHEVEHSEDRVMRRPYANGAQENEPPGDVRLACAVSYNGVALICTSDSEAQMIGDSLMESPLRPANDNEAGAMGIPYAGGAQERERSEPRLASNTSYIPSRLSQSIT